MKKLLFLMLALGLFVAQPSSATTISWTDWTAATTGTSDTATGIITLADGSTVTVTYTGDINFAQLGTGTNYWTEGNPKPYTGNTVISNAPTPAEMIAISASGVQNTLTFSRALIDPVFTIVSLGQPNYAVTYDFNTPFTFLSGGQGYWNFATGTSGMENYTLSGTPVDQLTGKEFHGAIQFQGPVTTISWTASPGEYWHGFTVGTPVPEPGTLLLLGTGLMGLIGLRLRRKSRS